MASSSLPLLSLGLVLVELKPLEEKGRAKKQEGHQHQEEFNNDIELSSAAHRIT